MNLWGLARGVVCGVGDVLCVCPSLTPRVLVGCVSCSLWAWCVSCVCPSLTPGVLVGCVSCSLWRGVW